MGGPQECSQLPVGLWAVPGREADVPLVLMAIIFVLVSLYTCCQASVVTIYVTNMGGFTNS